MQRRPFAAAACQVRDLLWGRQPFEVAARSARRPSRRRPTPSDHDHDRGNDRGRRSTPATTASPRGAGARSASASLARRHAPARSAPSALSGSPCGVKGSYARIAGPPLRRAGASGARAAAPGRRGLKHRRRTQRSRGQPLGACSRSSRIELASIEPRVGQLPASMSESENGWIGSRGWPITSVGAWICCAPRAAAPRARRTGPAARAADGFGSWLTQSRQTSRSGRSRAAPAARRRRAAARSARRT